MKKIILQVSITPNDDDVSVEDLKNALSKLGSTYFEVAEEVRMVDTDGVEFGPNPVWIYLSADEMEPAVLVKEAGETDGDEMSTEDLERLQEHGVCLKFHAVYPRADRYGAPGYASNDELAEVEVSMQGFAVPADRSLEATSADSGDDSNQNIWLQIGIPIQA